MEGEHMTMEDTGGREPYILANESVLMTGLVLRSWSNQISIRFHSDQPQNSGFIQLHYQGECVHLMCRDVLGNKLASPNWPLSWIDVVLSSCSCAKLKQKKKSGLGSTSFHVAVITYTRTEKKCHCRDVISLR